MGKRETRELYFNGKQQLAEMLDSLQKGEQLIVALCNMNSMQRINHIYGRTAGDKVLAHVEKKLRECVKAPDFVFRLRDDEFVVVFVDQELYQAEEWMKAVPEKINAGKEQLGITEPLSFCYGLARVRAEQKLPFMEVISEADRKMYAKKRDFHIEQNWKHLRENGAVVEHGTHFSPEEERLLNAFSENADGYAYIGNLKTGEFMYANRMVRDFGLPGQILQDAAAFWGERIHPDDRQLFLRSNQEIADGKANRHEIAYRARNAEGRWTPLLCRGAVSLDENGRPELFAGVITDLERHRESGGIFNSAAFYFASEKVEINSQEWEERLLDFVSHNLPGGIVAVLDEPGYPIVCFNRTLLDYTNSTYEELMQATGGLYGQLIYEQDRDMVAREVKKQLEMKESYEVYYRLLDSKGNIRWVCDIGHYAMNESGKRYIMSFFIDVTSEMEQKAELHIINKNSMDGIFRAAMTEGFPVLYANDGYYRMHGYTRAEFQSELDSKAEKVVYQEDMLRVAAEIDRAIQEGEENLVLEYRIVKRDGKMAWLHMVGSIYTLADGRTGLAGVVVDITKRRVLEEELLHTDWLYKMIRNHTKLNVWEFDVESRSVIFDKLSGGRKIYENVPECFIESGKIHPESIEAFRAMHEEIIRGAERSGAVVRLNRRDGGKSWKKLTYISFRNADGRNLRALGISEDVTLQREAELRAFHQEKTHRSYAAGSLYDFRLNVTANSFEEGWKEGQDLPVTDVKDVTYQRVYEAIRQLIANEDDRKRFEKYYSYEKILEYAKQDAFKQEFEYCQRYRNGEIIWVNLKFKIIASPVNGDKILFARAKNIDYLKRREFALSKKTEIDQDSGFYNQKTAELLIRDILRDNDGGSCLAIMDADAFWKVNQAGGYAAGDDILRQMTEIIRRQLSADCVPARLDGDMFMVYLYNTRELGELRKAIRQLRNTLSGSYTIGSHHLEVTVSVGAAELLASDEKNYDVLYQKAYQALGAAKRDGGNRTVFYNEMHGEIKSEEKRAETCAQELSGLVLQSLKRAEAGEPAEEIYRTLLAYLGACCQAKRITLFSRRAECEGLCMRAVWQAEGVTEPLDSGLADGQLFEKFRQKTSKETFRIEQAQGTKEPVFFAACFEGGRLLYGMVLEQPALRDGGRVQIERGLELVQRIEYQKRMKEECSYALCHDRDTGALNYDSYRSRMEALNEDTLSAFGIAAVQLVDLKTYNKEYGNDKGDECIRFAGNLLQEIFCDRECYRVGRNSFLVLCENMTYDSFAERCSRVRESIAEAYPDWIVSASAWESPVISVKKMREQVEEKLFVACSQKRTGNRVISDRMVAEALEKLKASLDNHEYLAFLQPKADVATGEICGAEALIRYRTADGAIVAPGAFLGEIERMGLIRYIDLFVLKEVCRLMKEWLEHGWKPFPVSLNYSRITILEEGILEETNRIVESYGIPKGLVEIEITESVSSIDRTSLKQIVDGFTQEGYKIAMDDYGADYSNIYILYSMELNTLKLDRRLVDDIWHDKKARVVVANIIDVCAKLGIECVAEGVETKEQLEVLREMSCDVYQGYYINKPIQAEDFASLYISW